MLLPYFIFFHSGFQWATDPAIELPTALIIMEEVEAEEEECTTIDAVAGPSPTAEALVDGLAQPRWPQTEPRRKDTEATAIATLIGSTEEDEVAAAAAGSGTIGEEIDLTNKRKSVGKSLTSNWISIWPILEAPWTKKWISICKKSNGQTSSSLLIN